MTTSSAARGLIKAVLVVAATAAGATTGGLLGMAYVLLLMPNAGLEGILPFAFGVLLGAAVGCLMELAVLFKVPRLDRGQMTWVVWVGAVSLVLGGIGFTVVWASDTDVGWAALLQVLLPLSLLMGVVGGSSVLYGRPPEADAPR